MAYTPKSQPKQPPVAVRKLKSGAEVCNLLTKSGRDEYESRKRQMLSRQNGICCLHGHIKDCPGKVNLADLSFDHEQPRGMGGGSRDDRIEVNGRWQNGAAHWRCNSSKGSRRIPYNDIHNAKINPK